MKKKVVGILVLMLFIGMVIPVMGLIVENEKLNIENEVTMITNNFDQLDQSYTNHAYGRNIGNASQKLAQTFKPSYPTITRLELLLQKEESGPTDYTIYLLKLYSGIPGGTGSLIYQTSYNSDILYTGTYWYEFDILDQVVLPGSTYHIMIYGTAQTDYTTNLRWRFGLEEPYTKGDAYQLYHGEWVIVDAGGTPCDFCFKTYGTDFGGNHGPSIPTIPSGPSTGKIGESYSYSTSSTDLDGDQIKYGFDWNGNGITIWSDFENSGDTCTKSHTWNNKGAYQLRVKAQDEHGRESGWSDPFTVTIPKANISLLERLVEKWPFIGRLLNNFEFQ